jgi:hypothetical protein
MKVDDLYYPSREQSIRFDLTSQPNMDENGDPVWDYLQFAEDEEDGKHYVYDSRDGSWTWCNRRTGHQISVLDDEPGVYAEGPMMDLFWPLGAWLPMDEHLIAWRMRHLNVGLVRIEDENQWGLALTGAGMDFSWDLAAGAVAAGFYPWLGLNIGSINWEFGVGQIGLAAAKRVRAAMRARMTLERRMWTYRLRDLEKCK